MLYIIVIALIAVLVQSQTPAPPFPAPSCPAWGRNKPGECNLQMESDCECDQNNVRCGHDGECPGNEKCCTWGCGCRAMCAPPGVTEWPVQGPLTSRCELPKVTGPCKALIPRFFYNPSTRVCEQFFYGGCCGNANNFETLAVCVSTCSGAPTYK